MDAPLLSPERSKELDTLRRRAYGPDADISRDPVAQQRLSELEDLARTPNSESVQTPDRVPVASHADSAGEEPAGDPLTSAAPSTPAPAGAEPERPPSTSRPAPRAVPWWRRIPLWAVGTVAGLVIGIVVGLAWPTDSEPPPDLTLGVDPGGGERGAGFTENLDYWGVDPGTVVPHEGYDAIQVWTALGIEGSRCILLSHDGSFLSATCSGAGLDPVLDFTVYDGMSLDLDTPLPVGTVIRFVGHEGSVDVWVRPPGGQDPEATSAKASLPSAA